jgi:lipoic acid synthetase
MTERRTFPEWLKKKWPADYDSTAADVLRRLRLNTVCRSAECPNLGECWHSGEATFLILGSVCTRACRYCGVANGRPTDWEELRDEPERVAQAVGQLKLRHVVITSVTRDDLPDGGAGHFAAVIRTVRRAAPEVSVEVLIPDFLGSEPALKHVLDAGPHVLAHNVECVERIFPLMRPQGDFLRSLKLLAKVKALSSATATKSGFMAGLGETADDVRGTLNALRKAGVDLLTMGQYLAPAAVSGRNPPPTEYVEPVRFAQYRTMALNMGFRGVAAGPFVRSSYRAADLYAQYKTVALPTKIGSGDA